MFHSLYPFLMKISNIALLLGANKRHNAEKKVRWNQESPSPSVFEPTSSCSQGVCSTAVLQWQPSSREVPSRPNATAMSCDELPRCQESIIPRLFFIGTIQLQSQPSPSPSNASLLHLGANRPICYARSHQKSDRFLVTWRRNFSVAPCFARKCQKSQGIN